MNEVAKMGFLWTFETIDRATGNVLHTEEVHNLMPVEGLNHMLGVTLKGVLAVPTWYVGVYEGAYTPLSTDTMATFPGAATECTAYASATRQALTLGAVAAGAVNNFSSTTDIAFNATKTIYGGFISSSSAKGGTNGVLLSAVRTAAPRVTDDTMTLRVKVSFTTASI